MTSPADLSRRHRRTIYALMTVLLLFLLTMDGLIITNQRSVLLEQTRKQVQHELELLGMLVSEALIKEDYATVEVFVHGWAKERKDILDASVVLDNGFVLAEFSRSAENPVKETYQRKITYGNNRSILVKIGENISDVHHLLIILTAKLLIASCLLVVVLGILLWKVLKAIAIIPLENEISQHEQTAIKLRDYAADLQAVNIELESFSYSVSHDLRAPLRAIDGFSLVLKEDYADAFDDTAHDYLQRIRLGAQRMSKLIDDMLQLSRISRHDIDKHAVDLSALANEAITRYRTLDPARQVEVSIDSDLRAFGDRLLLAQMLDNLISNAWKYTSTTPDAKIHIGKTVIDNKSVFYVKDNGVGFEMQYIDKLFGVFQRLHSNTQFEGSGVGLATVKRILTRHDGTVWAESEVGQGSTFYFTLPKNQKIHNAHVS